MKKIILIIVVFSFFQPANAQRYFDSSFYPNGNLQRYSLIGKKQNTLVQYKFYYNGKVSSVTTYYSLDYMHGYSVTAYNMNGIPAALYKIPTGDFREYYSNGSLKRTGQFYNLFKADNWKEYFINGKLHKEYSFVLTGEDSLFNKEVSWKNRDSFDHDYEKLEWGEQDTSLGEAYQFININKVDFY